MNKEKLVKKIDLIALTVFIIGFLTLIASFCLESLDIVDSETKATIFLIGCIVCLLSLLLDIIKNLLNSLLIDKSKTL